MEIKTKYIVGNIVYFYKKGKLIPKRIAKVEVYMNEPNYFRVKYWLGGKMFDEEKVFRTPEEFFNRVEIEELQ